ncbi:ribosome small subunit-dependent GTPase A [Oleidesulfovibrio sp.]|uniref:ribosome small subunit-dependent GTPase A n=1 Tax=Oleidesulfovibrio sp. TaxID=2909707 RepID=UPI003A83CC5E
MTHTVFDLNQLGWGPFYLQQLSLEEWEATYPARVSGVRRKNLTLISEAGTVKTTIPGSWFQNDAAELPTVGDWLLMDKETDVPVRMLNRKSSLQRRAPGKGAQLQSLAANIDTLFIVTSCNNDFNQSRIERYLTLALAAGVTPVMVITKSDMAEDADEFARQAKRIRQSMEVCTVNALDADSVATLHCWCETGQTLALVGSSGVGKSTLVNTLSGAAVQATGAIREDDSRGRHTTSERSLHFLPSGAILIDTPGIRELQLADCEEGLALAFDDIEQLASSCRFSNCTHQHEAECAVKAAVRTGRLEARRLENYLKILQEQERNTLSIAEKRNKDATFAKMCRQTMAARKKRK